MLRKDFENFCSSINAFNDSPTVEGMESVREEMYTMLEQAILAANVKDKFEYSWSPAPFTISVYAQSLKTQAQYQFVFNHLDNTLHLESHIYNPYNLKNLQDGFLIEFFNICNTNNFSYKQNAFSPSAEKKYPDLHKTFKGNIFRLMRNYFLFISEYEINENSKQVQDLDLGYFTADWDFTKDIETIYSELCLAMKWFYKFNYTLWKIEDLKNKKDQQKAR